MQVQPGKPWWKTLAVSVVLATAKIMRISHSWEVYWCRYGLVNLADWQQSWQQPTSRDPAAFKPRGWARSPEQNFGCSVGGRQVGGRQVGGRQVGGRQVGGRQVGGRQVGGRQVGGPHSCFCQCSIRNMWGLGRRSWCGQGYGGGQPQVRTPSQVCAFQEIFGRSVGSGRHFPGCATLSLQSLIRHLEIALLFFLGGLAIRGLGNSTPGGCAAAWGAWISGSAQGAAHPELNPVIFVGETVERVAIFR